MVSNKSLYIPILLANVSDVRFSFLSCNIIAVLLSSTLKTFLLNFPFLENKTFIRFPPFFFKKKIRLTLFAYVQIGR